MRVPETIRTPAQLKEKLQLLEALGDIEIAIKALNQQSDIENPIDRHYEQLDCAINRIDKSEKLFSVIEQYLHKTHAPTHCTYTMKLIDLFEVEKKHEKENFKDLGNR
jgi:poly [ADP-ribose] polymerase